MTVIDEPVIDEPLGDPMGESHEHGEGRTAWDWFVLSIKVTLLGILAFFVLWLLITEQKARTTVIVAAASIFLSAAVWIGANLIFNQVRDHWSRFNGLVFGISGVVVGGVLAGNRFISGATDGGFFNWVWFPLLFGAACAVVGVALSAVDAPTTRLAVGVGGFAGLGLLTGVLLDDSIHPELDIVPLLVWTAIGAALGAGWSLFRGHPPVGGALIMGALGWLVGAFPAQDLGTGSAGWAIVAVVVPFAAFGLRLALGTNPNLQRRAKIDNGSRAVIFLAPALLFIAATLVIPTIRTLYLSFYDSDSIDFVKLGNYVDIFQDPNSWNPDNWSNMFFSWPMIIGLILLAVFAVVGWKMKQRTGKVVELGSPSSGPLIVGGLFVAFAVFTALRGTFVNNIWWVVVVTLFSTALGLAVAVLADGVGLEKMAKSIVFMPMAISLVGASVIWRFMYVARDSSKEQTGVLNALWVGLGRLSTGQSISSVAFVILLALGGMALLITAVRKGNWALAIGTLVGTPLVLVGFAWGWSQLSGDVAKALFGLLLTAVWVSCLAVAVQALTKREWGRATVPGIVALMLGWFLIRYWAIVGGGVGGQATNSNGETVPNPINFIQEQPYNNVFLMVVLIWIQTGFAMVILSAAIKAVPDEIIEAARVDGATPSQIFWRVTLPQIAPTIGVVVTTIIVLVMKVYDIVKVMTNSNFGTQVLANDMFAQAFQFTNTGRGAALAMLIFISVLPVMIGNIRRMQREN